MPQPKGKSGNYKGKPVGTKNKITSDVREALQKLFDGIADTLPDTLAKLAPTEKLNFIAKILPYLTPKMESVSVVTSDDEKTIIINETIISSEKYFAQSKALESYATEPELDYSKLTQEQLIELRDLKIKQREIENNCL